jgi:hypothetical protein
MDHGSRAAEHLNSEDKSWRFPLNEIENFLAPLLSGH